MAASIVCGVDESASARRAARVAAALAERLAARLVLVHVTSPATVAAPAGALAPVLLPTQTHELEASSRAVVEAVAAEEGVTAAAIRTEVGDTAATLVRTAEEESAEMLVVGTRGRSGLAAAVLGSVSSGVIQRARCPVLAVPKQVDDARWPDATGPIVGGVHDVESGREVVRVAASLSRRLDVRLALLHVAPPVTLPGLSAVPGAAERVAKLEVRDGDALLADVAERERLNGSVEREVVVGPSAKMLLDYAAKVQARLLVIGGSRRVAWTPALLGRVWPDVAARASCPVVVVPSVRENRDGDSRAS